MAATRSVTWAASSTAAVPVAGGGRGQQRGEQGLGPVVVGGPAGGQRADGQALDGVTIAGGGPGQGEGGRRRGVVLGVGGPAHAVEEGGRPLDVAGLEQGQGHPDEGVALADGVHVEGVHVDALELGDGPLGVTEGHEGEHGDDLAGEALGLIGLLAQGQAPGDGVDALVDATGGQQDPGDGAGGLDLAADVVGLLHAGQRGLGRGQGLVGPTRPHPHRGDEHAQHALGPAVAAVAGLRQQALGQGLGVGEVAPVELDPGQQALGPAQAAGVADAGEDRDRRLQVGLGHVRVA